MSAPEQTPENELEVQELTEEILEDVTGGGRAEDWGNALASPGTRLTRANLTAEPQKVQWTALA
jgi:hypothetical protein